MESWTAQDYRMWWGLALASAGVFAVCVSALFYIQMMILEKRLDAILRVLMERR